MDNNIFFCYSNKMMHFLSALGFRYINHNVNQKSKSIYWTYSKSAELDSAIQDYNAIKHKYN